MKRQNKIYVLVAEKDIQFFISNFNFLIKNLGIKYINVICHKSLKKYFNHLPQLVFIDEDKVLEGLNYNKIKKYLEKRINNNRRAGWYLQQFIKLALCNYVETDYYTVIDCDTLPLNTIKFFEKKTELPIFSTSKEFHQPYFDTMQKIFKGKVKKNIQRSFINEFMIFKTIIVRKMIKEIAYNNDCKENEFFLGILDNIDFKVLNNSGFSEFETYGSYVNTYFKDSYIFKDIKSLREGIKYFGANPNRELLLWGAKDFDLISIERSDKVSRFAIPIKYSLIRSIFPLRYFVNIRNFLRWIYNL